VVVLLDRLLDWLKKNRAARSFDWFGLLRPDVGSSCYPPPHLIRLRETIFLALVKSNAMPRSLPAAVLGVLAVTASLSVSLAAGDRDELARALKKASGWESYTFAADEMPGPGTGGALEARYQKGKPLSCQADRIEFFRHGDAVVYREGDRWLRSRTGTTVTTCQEAPCPLALPGRGCLPRTPQPPASAGRPGGDPRWAATNSCRPSRRSTSLTSPASSRA